MHACIHTYICTSLHACTMSTLPSSKHAIRIVSKLICTSTCRVSGFCFSAACPCVQLCMYLCLHVHGLHARMHSLIGMHTKICVCACVHTTLSDMQRYRHADGHTFIHVFTHTDIHTPRIHICTDVRINQNTHPHRHTCANTWTYVGKDIEILNQTMSANLRVVEGVGRYKDTKSHKM